jgi:hypothetical protein
MHAVFEGGIQSSKEVGPGNCLPCSTVITQILIIINLLRDSIILSCDGSEYSILQVKSILYFTRPEVAAAMQRTHEAKTALIQIEPMSGGGNKVK